MYGIQTREHHLNAIAEFENDVNMYGIQTDEVKLHLSVRLRMM